MYGGICVLLWGLCVSVGNAGTILMLVDNLNIRETHSVFIKSLSDRGHKLTVKLADDPSLALTKYGVRLYDNLMLFAPGVDEFGGTVNVKEITQFTDDGGNVLLAAGTHIGDALRDLAAEYGFEFDEDRTSVIDHLNYDTVMDEGEHTTIVTQPSQLMLAPIIMGEASNQAPVLFKGSALVADKNNRLRLELMTASTTAYSFNPQDGVQEYPAALGHAVVLTGALQARNNARIVLTGSLAMFSDAFINANVNKIGSTSKPAKSGNLKLITELSKWVLMEKGVLRVNDVSHHRVGKKSSPGKYTVLEQVNYEIDIEELKNGKWLPFDGKDVQLEFVRIDPFLRTTLNNKNGKHRTQFILPDVYGVFKFLVDYRRVGYTHLNHVRQVSVRPLEHTQYERFIRSAFPYYASSFSMMLGVVLMSFVYLYHKDIHSPKND